MPNWIQHYAVTRLVLTDDNSFSFASGDCQMIPLDMDSASLVIVNRSGMRTLNNLSAGPFDLKCIEYSVAMINLADKKLRTAHFFHQFKKAAFIEKRLIRSEAGNLFELHPMNDLVSSKDLKGYKGIQFTD